MQGTGIARDIRCRVQGYRGGSDAGYRDSAGHHMQGRTILGQTEDINLQAGKINNQFLFILLAISNFFIILVFGGPGKAFK